MENVKVSGPAVHDGEGGPREVDQHSERIDFEPTPPDNDQHSTALIMSREARRVHGVDLNDCERELAECPDVFGEPTIYGELFALDIHGKAIRGAARSEALNVEAVVFLAGGRFEFARRMADQTGAVRAVVFAVFDEDGEIVDIAAWQLGEATVSLWRGTAGALGLEQAGIWQIAPLAVHETPLDWFRAERLGVFIIDPESAAPSLDGITLSAPNISFGHRVRARLAPFMQRAPSIAIPRSAARG